MTDVAVVFSEKVAKRTLKAWYRDKSTSIFAYESAIYCEYPPPSIPFWAFIVLVYGNFCGEYGFHVYQDGQVKLIGRIEVDD